MLKTQKRVRRIAYGKTRPSKTIPDQSMNIQELVRRYVKGIPVDVVQREKVYIDQSVLDLEKLGRVDAADRAFQAMEMRTNNDLLAQRIKESVALRQSQQANENKRAEQEVERKNKPGIDNLDNTMPVDTELTNSELRGQKNSRSKPNQ